MSSTFGLIARTVAVVALAMVLFTTQSAVGQAVDVSGKWRNVRTGTVYSVTQQGKYVRLRGLRKDGLDIRGTLVKGLFRGQFLEESSTTHPSAAEFRRRCPHLVRIMEPVELRLSADGLKLVGRIRESIRTWSSGRSANCRISRRKWDSFTLVRITPRRPPVVTKPKPRPPVVTKPKPRPPLRALTTCTQCKAQLRQSIKEGFNAFNLSLLPNWVDESINDFQNCEPKTKSRVCRIGRILVRTIRGACKGFRRPQLRPKAYEACLKRAVP